MTELSDELLVAYVDGQLARKQSSAVDKVLAQDDVIAKRVDALKDAHSRLEAAFDAILAGEQADAETEPVPHGPGLFIPRDTLVKTGLAAAGIAAALVLIVAGYGWPLVMPEFARSSLAPADPEFVGSVPPTWQEEAARAQALLGRASLEVGLDSQGNRDLIAFQLAQAIGPRFDAARPHAARIPFHAGAALAVRRGALGADFIFGIARRAACALRQEGRGDAGARVQALWRHRRCGLVARRPVLSPRRRRTGGAVAEARRHDQSVKGGARRRACRSLAAAAGTSPQA